MNEYIREDSGELFYCTDGKAVDTFTGRVTDKKFCMLASDLQKYGKQGQITAIAQFYMLVLPGLIMARHIFRGLERPLLCNDNMKGDTSKLIYTWKPTFDYEWIGGRFGEPKERPTPQNSVFCVIVSPNIRNSNIEKFPYVYGWIERWNWVKEDKGLPEAPINWVDRYKKKIYTRP